MSAAAATTALPREAVNAKLIALIVSVSIAFGIFLTGFVVREPAPYELFMALVMPIWALFGLRISRTVAPMALLLVLFVIGGMISMNQMDDVGEIPLYLAVSLFLALTGVFFAAVLESRPDLYKLIFWAWTAAAIATSALGIVGYFGLTGEMFTLYGRAAGAFKDPNVFGPFLVLPAVFMLQQMLTGRASSMPLHAAILVFLTAGIFLSFSRGAWGLFVFSGLAVTGGLYLSSTSNLFRLRIILMGFVALVLLGVALVVALQIPAVADLFSERAQLAQSYDTARLGRFARYVVGFQMAMEHPLGIGPLEFGQTFGEDTHNIWLKSLLDYSWLGFAAYLTLIVWSIAGGFRILFRDRPWQPFLLTAYVVFIGHVLLGTVIDTNHWRHFYLLLGMIWGAMALEARWQLTRRGSLQEARD
ncbi:MAG: O-antigen ligase family protein [Rhizobiaceae bacterium]